MKTAKKKRRQKWDPFAQAIYMQMLILPSNIHIEYNIVSFQSHLYHQMHQ